MSAVRPLIRDTSAQDVPVEPTLRAAGARRRWLVGGALAALLVALAAPAVARWWSAEASVDGRTLRVATVTRGRFVSDVSVQGRIVAAVSPTLTAPAAGIATPRVTAGQPVRSGDVLAVVEAPDVVSEYQRERSTLQSLQAAWERQRIEARAEHARNRQTADLAAVTLAAAQREFERHRRAFDQGLVSRQELDRREDQLREAEVRHRHALEDVGVQDEKLGFEVRTRQLDVERQRVVVAELERRVDELTLRSPVDGVVGSLAIAQRATVGSQQPLVTVVDLSLFEVEIDVPEAYADDLASGMAAEIAYGSARYPGSIAAISPEVRNGQVTGRVRFDGDPPADLRQNQRVSVRLVLEEKPDALMVDRGAFFESGGGRIAYVVDGAVARRTPIRTGSTSLGKVEIVEGLTEGQSIVISGTDGFGGAGTVLIRN